MGRFRTRVVSYGFDNTHWAMEYSNSWGIFWGNLYWPLSLWGYEWNWQPLIRDKYEYAIEDAKRFDSMEKIREYNVKKKEEAQKYQDRLNNYLRNLPPNKVRVI
jgi:hypothetical protein